MVDIRDYVSEPNLFRYATSELSQDAFICWLLSYAKENGQSKDAALHDCAIAFFKDIVPAESIVVTDIQRQHQHIDVLVTVNDKWKIIIEDKTFTDVHGNQISVYKDALIKEGVPDGDIKTVFYKIVEQAGDEAVDKTYGRKELLELFNQYRDKTENNIFQDYVAYLTGMDDMVNSWSQTPIKEWNNEMYWGFFTHLNAELFDQASGNWQYVANPSGGLMGLWFNGYSCGQLHISRDILENIYLQIEDNIIALKIHMQKTGPKDQQAKIRWKLYEDMKKIVEKHVGVAYKKKAFRPGEYVSAGYIEYDEKNYADRVRLMQDALETIVAGWQ